MNLVSVEAVLELHTGDIYFKCPFCWSAYKKRINNPLKSATAKFHSVKQLVQTRLQPLQFSDNRYYLDLIGDGVPCDPERFPFINGKRGFRVMLPGFAIADSTTGL